MNLKRWCLCMTIALVGSCPVPAQPCDAGRIFVANDDWILSDTGFASLPVDTGHYADNLARWFVPAGTGNFLVYSANHAVAGARLATHMTTAGHSWTLSTTVSFDLNTLLRYDAIFLAGTGVPNVSILIQYVEQGGGVYLAAGTSSSSSGVAALWNPFLMRFGLQLESSLNNLCAFGCRLPIQASHPVLAGVQALYHDRGQDVNDLDPYSVHNGVVYVYQGHELFAAYDGVAAVAGAVVRNGMGSNPVVFVETARAVLGTTWSAAVDLAALGAPVSVVVLGGAVPHGLLLPIGELLCGEPYLWLPPGPGVHSIPVPPLCLLDGRQFVAQGAGVGPTTVRLTNALEVTVGNR